MVEGKSRGQRTGNSFDTVLEYLEILGLDMHCAREFVIALGSSCVVGSVELTQDQPWSNQR